MVEQPWDSGARVLAQVLTSDEWSSERAHLVGRTRLHFVVAVRGVETVQNGIRFRFIADSPDLRHPLTGFVELESSGPGRSMLRVTLHANLSDEPPDQHLMVREAIASLADVLGRTMAEALAPTPAESGHQAPQ